MNHQSSPSFIWSVVDLLRGDFKQSGYGKVILPFTGLQRLDCFFALTRTKVLAEYAAKHKAGLNPDLFLLRAPDPPKPLSLPSATTSTSSWMVVTALPFLRPPNDD